MFKLYTSTKILVIATYSTPECSDNHWKAPILNAISEVYCSTEDLVKKLH